MASEVLREANGLRFRCLEAGPAGSTPVLLLHGFPEGAESWSAQLEALAGAGLHAVAPDLRGYGGSDAPATEEAYRLALLVADITGLIDALGAERIHLAGHDWGALVGWAFAAQHADRLLSWSALSVGHPAAFARAAAKDEDQRNRSAYIRLFRERGKAEQVLAEDGYQRLRAMYRIGPDPDAIPEPVIERFVANLARPGRLTAALNYYRAALADLAGLGPVSVPSQLVWGDQDPAVGATGTQLTASYMTGPYQLEVLPGAGHWLQFERPDQVSRLLVRHCQANPPE
ncbi:MAG TPA: alpha/beta hydrolase [Candidatus Dormibacteraeota bacterium]